MDDIADVANIADMADIRLMWLIWLLRLIWMIWLIWLVLLIWLIRLKPAKRTFPNMHKLLNKFGQYPKSIFLYSCLSDFSSIYLKLHFALCTMIRAYYSFLTAWVKRSPKI